MKVTRNQLRKIIKERLNALDMSEYALYDRPEAAEAEAEFDALFDEVALFMTDAKKRLDALMQKHAGVGADDTESSDMIYDAFKAAKSGMR